MAKGLFAKAASKAPKTAKEKDQKTRITIEDPSFFDKIEKLENLNDVIKSATAKKDMISDELRDIAKDKWCSLYDKTGKNPGSVMLENVKGEDCAQVMFIPQDKYISITEGRAEELREAYGEEIIEEKTTFSFDNLMVEKYGEIISRLIEESDEIEDSEKEKIIKASVVYSITKGTIDKMKSFGPVSEIMENVKPIVALRNVEIIRG